MTVRNKITFILTVLRLSWVKQLQNHFAQDENLFLCSHAIINACTCLHI